MTVLDVAVVVGHRDCEAFGAVVVETWRVAQKPVAATMEARPIGGVDTHREVRRE
jgi:hypothetical protein